MAIVALYRAREDGDYDFVAAFDDDVHVWDGSIAETYADALRAEGEEVLVKTFGDLNQLVDVLVVEEETEI